MRQDRVERLLEREIADCARDPVLAELRDVTIKRDGTDILVSFQRGRDGRPGLFRLNCRYFDVHPPSVTMLNLFSHSELPINEWTRGVPHSIHPRNGKPFVCIQGVAEYHSHPSHLHDGWDRYRYRYRIPQTIKKLLHKAGATK